MTQVFRLPDLGEGLTEAEIVTWLVRVGDEVGIDQEVVTVETAKAAVDVPIPFGGTVSVLHAQEGQVLPVGEPLITIGGKVVAGADAPGAGGGSAPAGADLPTGAGGEQYRTEERAGARVPEGDEEEEDKPERPLIGYGASDQPVRRAGGRRRRPARSAPEPSAAASPITSASVSPAPSPVTSASVSPAASRNGRQAVRVISPLVRKLAQDAGVDLQQVRPGPTGVIRRLDLDAYLAQQRAERVAGQGAERVAGQGAADGSSGRRAEQSPGREETRIPIQGVHRIMVERLSTSRREIPDATTWVDVDATRLMKAKDALKEARPEAGIGVLPLLARIVVAGLTAYPALNSSVDVEAGEIVQHGGINLGFAAQSPRGLVVPVVHDAQALTTTELAQRLRELTAKAREGKLSPADMTGGTFTLNNYGVYGVDGSTPIINHPEAAMLGVGRIVDKPWVHKGKLKVRQVTQLSFTFDHRVCDGGTAGGFLRFVADCVEDPRRLLTDL
ncbi:dihydrolipoamide acetyltransferase family protein [Ornithinimicrobium pratense]|uniref:Dihydrolipoamide acetyltransferase component of pyruvate dehydrogenase complex n=1 Tax=Ornithinimicrobium pratense TaxID=2593973 RepID=A0A5J6V9T0_9MICO|nr:dihydrolipoamide acetyltransferase family protein [Ornithinimicrobium pratense]QFG69802.1 2-oxo acid dehydrogenase subunit E2 [Ornithinimicrobium pratense]